MAVQTHRFTQIGTGPEAAGRLLYRVEDAAQLLSISRTKLYGLMRNDVIPSVLIGGTRLIAHDDLRAYVDALRAGAEPYAEQAP